MAREENKGEYDTWHDQQLIIICYILEVLSSLWDSRCIENKHTFSKSNVQ